jgi:hypothetical protein
MATSLKEGYNGAGKRGNQAGAVNPAPCLHDSWIQRILLLILHARQIPVKMYIQMQWFIFALVYIRKTFSARSALLPKR